MKKQKTDKIFFSASFRQMALLIAAPSGILLLLAVILACLNYFTLSNSVTESSYQTVKTFFQYNEALIENFSSSILSSDDHSEVTRAMAYEDYIYDQEQFRKACAEFSSAFPFAEQFAVIDKSSNQVLTPEGAFSLNDYFQNVCVYAEFSASYFRTFQFYTTEKYRVLLPSAVTRQGQQAHVLPVVIRKSSAPQTNLLIVNINLQKLFAKAHEKFRIPDIPIYIYNKYHNEITAIQTSDNPPTFSDEFIAELLAQPNKFFPFSFDGDRYLVSSYSSSSSIIGYVFFSATPQTALLLQIRPMIFLTVGMVLLFWVLVGFLLVRSANTLADPLEKLLVLLSRRGKVSGRNVLDAITHATINLDQENEQLSLVRSSAQKQLLSSLMTSTEYANDEQVNRAIMDSLDFPWNFYAVITISLLPAAGFFDLFNQNEYVLIRKGFYNLVESLFAEKFTCTVIPEKNNQLWIVLNFASPEDYATADEILSELYCNLQEDRDYVTFSVGKSELVSSLSDLHRAYADACENVTEYDLKNAQLTPSAHFSDELKFTAKDENNLFLALISWDREGARRSFAEILEENGVLSPRCQKRLFNYILNVLIRVIRMKNLPLGQDKLDFEILNEYLNQPPQDVQKSILNLIDFIMEQETADKSDMIDYDKIVQYISENFSMPDLSLKYLADQFFVNQNNLSTALKAKLGVGFHEYVTRLRVEKAKELLATTNSTNQEILRLCGFTSAQTFYRVFKDNTGMTSSEFRKRSQEK